MNIYFQQTYQRTFGTFPLKGDDAFRAVLTATEVGYRSFDTAQSYGNEVETGNALKASGIDRSDLCITTKVDVKNYADADFIPSVERSLKNLRVDEVDVLLLHWPTPGFDIRRSLELLQEAFDRGLAANIGVSNFTPQGDPR